MLLNFLGIRHVQNKKEKQSLCCLVFTSTDLIFLSRLHMITSNHLFAFVQLRVTLTRQPQLSVSALVLLLLRQLSEIIKATFFHMSCSRGTERFLQLSNCCCTKKSRHFVFAPHQETSVDNLISFVVTHCILKFNENIIGDKDI